MCNARGAHDAAVAEWPPESRLWRAPNLLLTPHMAGDTPRRYRRSWEFVGEQVKRLLAGEALLNVIHRDDALTGF